MKNKNLNLCSLNIDAQIYNVLLNAGSEVLLVRQSISKNMSSLPIGKEIK